MNGGAFDVAVVGGGPAGSAAALCALRGGARTLLFEPRGSVFEKPCGEGVLPRGVRVLQELSAAPRSGEYVEFRRLEYWIDGAKALELDLGATAWAIERPVLLAGFERALAPFASSARAGAAELERVEQRAEVRREAMGFELSTPDARTWTARTVITASGARARHDAERASTRLGIRARFDARVELDHVEVHLGSGCEVYLTPLAHGRVNVAVLADESAHDERSESGRSGAAAWLERALALHPAAARVTGALVTAAAAMPIRAGWKERRIEDGRFPCGDAIACVDPILGAGVAMALESGRLAAGAALRALANVRQRASARAADSRVPPADSRVPPHDSRVPPHDSRVPPHESRAPSRDSNARAHDRCARSAARRSMWTARGLLFLARRPRLARVTLRVLARQPWLARAAVRFATGSARERPEARTPQPPSERARRSVPRSHSSS